MLRHSAVVLLGAIFALGASADELVYEPVNPAFGGDPYNGTWLLNNAQAQDTFEDPDAVSPDLDRGSELDQFNETLERIALSRIATQLVEKFLEGDASFLETENLLITTTTNPDGSTTIRTTDKATGATTEVVIQ
jgi:curli production assembly/transport component CsgF